MPWMGEVCLPSGLCVRRWMGEQVPWIDSYADGRQDELGRVATNVRARKPATAKVTLRRDIDAVAEA